LIIRIGSEVKHHGFRALAHVDGHHCKLVSRNGHTFKHWPQLCEELARAVKPHDAVIDGEIVCLDARGRSNFKSLVFRREWPYFYAFDLLAVMAKSCEGGAWSRGSAGCAD
jgi:ATP-dependent DNA ligase